VNSLSIAFTTVLSGREQEMQTESFYLSTPIGQIQVFCHQNKITELDLGIDDEKSFPPHLKTTEKSMSSFASRVKRQLLEYFSNALVGFDADIQVKGTPFQRSVWDVISSVKVGETLTYSDVARQLDSSPRAVGNACRANPVPIIVPCHRIVSKSGIGGFAGEREGNNINIKYWLLEHEKSCQVKQGRAGSDIRPAQTPAMSLR